MYAPVLRPNTMRLITSTAVEKLCTLKQGGCKKAFCQGILPDNEITIVKPPIGDSDAKKDEYWLLKHTLYGLRCSPRHWYTKISAILTQLGLCENASDPCFLTGQVVNPLDPAVPATSLPLTLGLYVDDLVYVFEVHVVEWKFELPFSQLITVEYMGTIEWFLGIHFQWLITDDIITVHLRQTGFAAHLVEDNNVHTCNVTADATPYRPGLPINAIPKSDKADGCPALIGNNKASLAQLDGSDRVLAWSLLPYTPSSQLIATNRLKVTGMQHYLLCTTFTPPSNTDSLSPLNPRNLYIPSCLSLPCQTPKSTSMHCLPNQINIIVSPHTVMHVGDLNSAMPSMKASNYHFLNSGAWAVPSSCALVVPLCGRPTNRSVLH